MNFMRLSLMKGAHAAVSSGPVQEIRGISLVFREMWDTTALHRQPLDLTKDHQGSGRVPHVRTSVHGPKTTGEALERFS